MPTRASKKRRLFRLGTRTKASPSFSSCNDSPELLQLQTLSRNSSPSMPRDHRYAICSCVTHLQTATLALSTFKIAHHSPPCLVRSTNKFRQPLPYCRLLQHPPSGVCPARGNYCGCNGKKDYFASVCRSWPMSSPHTGVHKRPASRQAPYIETIENSSESSPAYSSLQPELAYPSSGYCDSLSLHRQAQRRRLGSTQRSMDCNTDDR